MSTTIEQLELEVSSNSKSAVSGIDALSASLTKLKGAVKGGIGLNSAANQITKLNSACQSLDGSANAKIDKLTQSLSKLSALGKIKISSSIANQIKGLGDATKSLSSMSFAGLDKLSSSMKELGNLEKAKGLSSALSQLKKIPEITKSLSSSVISDFTSKIKQLSDALAPLASQLNVVGNAFQKLPTNIRRAVNATDKVSRSNMGASTSYINIWARARMAYNGIRVA